MDTVKLEKQLRLVPLVCFVLILFLRKMFESTGSLLLTIGTIILGFIAVGSFLFRIYLEKQNGTFVAKKYYIFYFIIIIWMVMYFYEMIQK
ncbi:hypothetical protein [Flavobacterium sp.]|jgi:hypothetical protein|uniref:hypothetical protein n=1 Tax=Flavobacterium sp. TaxID=239 RepID=UPI0037C15B89